MTSLSAAVRNINHTTIYNISALCLGYYRFELTDFPKKNMTPRSKKHVRLAVDTLVEVVTFNRTTENCIIILSRYICNVNR